MTDDYGGYEVDRMYESELCPNGCDPEAPACSDCVDIDHMIDMERDRLFDTERRDKLEGRWDR